MCLTADLVSLPSLSVIRMVTDDEQVNYPVLVVFLEQFIAILKVLSDNVHNLTEDLRAIDIPSTLYTLATFIARVDDADAAALRLRVKFCNLCTGVFGRTEPVMMRNKEGGMRQNIVDIIVEWVQEVTVGPLVETRIWCCVIGC